MTETSPTATDPRAETTVGTLRAAALALAAAAHTRRDWLDSDTLPTPDVIHVLRKAGLPVAIAARPAPGTETAETCATCEREIPVGTLRLRRASGDVLCASCATTGA